MTSRVPDPASRPPTPNTTPASAADALARAAEQITRDDAATREAMARSMATRGAALKAFMWVLIAANVVLWLVFPPSGPNGTDPRDTATVERDLRLTVAAAADEVESYRAEHGGALPVSLLAAQVQDSGLTYIVRDSVTYEIGGIDGSVRVSYVSTTPVAEFLATSAGGRR